MWKKIHFLEKGHSGLVQDLIALVYDFPSLTEDRKDEAIPEQMSHLASSVTERKHT